MLYFAYQAHSDFMVPMRTLANLAINVLAPERPTNATAFTRNLSAAYELISRAGLTHDRPPFGIESVMVGNQEVAVHEEAARVTPFGTLLHFKKHIDTAQPRVLVVAPLSGHFATLLRATVRTLLSDNDVYITDWHNARDVPRSAGRFGFDDYIQHIVDFLETMGPGAHVVAVCQPCVAALVATAVMAQDANPAQPRSITLMAGPIDTRVNPTKVNELANSKPIEWFEQNLIATVPMRYRGSFRRVYPGFVQLAAFMSDEHRAPRQGAPRPLRPPRQRRAREGGRHQGVLRRVFRRARPHRGVLHRDGEAGVPGAPRCRSASSPSAACRSSRAPSAAPCCSPSRASATTSARSARRSPPTTSARGLRPYLKRHHMQAGVGHYGVFSGNRWTNQIYPIIKNVILSSE